jgi:hypothetical protein
MIKASTSLRCRVVCYCKQGLMGAGNGVNDLSMCQFLLQKIQAADMVLDGPS